MDDDLWSHVDTSDLIQTEAAKSKRPPVDEPPVQQRMRDGIKPAQQKAPTTDQKKVRRQMSKSAGEGAGQDAGNGHTYLPDGGLQCPSSDKTASVRQTSAGPVCSNCSKSLNAKESSMTTQPTEADLLDRLAKAATLSEAKEASDALNVFRIEAKQRADSERSLDWGAVSAAPVYADPGLPAITSSSVGVQSSVDWLDAVLPEPVESGHLANTMRAEATLWYEGQWDLLKQDPDEFAIAAHNAARREGSVYGTQGPEAQSVFIEHVAHLHTKAGYEIVVEAGEYGGGSPKAGDEATCHADGKKIQFFDGAWYHLKGGPSHNDVYPPNKSEREAKESGLDTTAVTTGPDAFAGGAETTQGPPYNIPQGSHLPNPTNKDTFDGRVNGENGPTQDPKTSPDQNANLGEGDQPEGDQSASSKPPITDDDANYAKDKSQGTTYVDPMYSGGKPSVKQQPAYPTASLTRTAEHPDYYKGFEAGKKDHSSGKTLSGWAQGSSDHYKRGWSDGYEAAAGSKSSSLFATLRETFGGGDSGLVPSDSPSLSEGDQPEGDGSAPAENPIAGQTFDSSSWDSAGADYLDTGGTGNAAAGAAGSPGTPTTGSLTAEAAEFKHVAPGPVMHDPRGRITEPWAHNFGSPEHPEHNDYTDKWKGLHRQNHEPEEAASSADAFWTEKPHQSSLREMGERVHTEATTENTRVFGRALATMASLDEKRDAFTGHDIVAMVLASGDVTEESRSALEALAADEDGGQVCAVCGAKIEKDPPGENPSTWHHADGSSHDHEAKPKGEDKTSGVTATRYCPTHKVYVGEGNQENHDHCPVETRKKADAGLMPPFGVEGAGRRRRGNDFSISDAKNEEGEWIMSPEQIRAEMAYSDEPDDDPYGDDGYYGSLQTTAEARPLYEIAADIKRNWPNPYFGAAPYLDALSQLSTMDDSYYEDPASTIVAYLLSNMGSKFKGPEAARLKAELKSLQKRGSKTAVHLTDVGFEDKAKGLGKGKDPSGNKVVFRLTDKEKADLSAVLYSDLAGNFAGVDVEQSDIVSHAGPTDTSRGDTTPVSPNENPFTGAKVGAHSTTCPKCGSQMDNVRVHGNKLTAKCDNCGWSGTKTKQSAKTAEHSTDTSPGRWKAQVAGTGENVWSQNSLTFGSKEEAEAYARDLGSRWFGMDMARVVPVETPNREAVDPGDPAIVLNYRG